MQLSIPSSHRLTTTWRTGWVARSRSLCIAALVATGWQGSTAAPAIESADRTVIQELGRVTRSAHERFGPASKREFSAQQLASLLDDADPDVNLGAASALVGRSDSGDELARLARAYGRTFVTNGDQLVRSTISPFMIACHFDGLALDQRQPAIDQLRSLLQFQASPSIGSEAGVPALLRGLVYHGVDSPEAYRLFRTFVRRPGVPLEQRQIAAWGMSVSEIQARTPDARAELEQRLADPAEDAQVRAHSAAALAALQDVPAVDRLLDALIGADDTMRRASSFALHRLVVQLPISSPPRAHLLKRVNELLDKRQSPQAHQQLIHLARRGGLAHADALTHASRLLRHDAQEVMVLAGDWLLELTLPPLPVTDAARDVHQLATLYVSTAPGSDRSTIAARALTTVLMNMETGDLSTIDERHWPALRRLATQLREIGRQDKVTAAAQAASAAADPTTGVNIYDSGIDLPELSTVIPMIGVSLPENIFRLTNDAVPVPPRSDFVGAPLHTWTKVGSVGYELKFGMAAGRGLRDVQSISGKLGEPLKVFPIEEASGTIRAADRIDAYLDKAADTAWNRISKAAEANSVVAVVLIVVAVLLVLLAISVLSFLAFLLYFLVSKRPWRLAGWGRAIRATGTGRVQLPWLSFHLPSILRWIVCIAPFERRAKVLDAWVAHHLGTMQARFADLPAIRLRSQVFARPLFVEGRMTPGDFGPEEARSCLRLNDGEPLHRALLVVHGDGGSGKTTLACEIAHWAWATNPAKRLHPRHPIVPIFIERDFNRGGAASADPLPALLGAIRDELQQLLGARDKVDAALVADLLQQHRLLVIVDHVSELGEASRSLLAKVSHADFPVTLLVLTSRSPEPEVSQATRVHIPLVRGHAAASALYWHFLRARHVDRFQEPLTDARHDIADHHLRGLCSMVRDRSVSVLLVQLYADFVWSQLEDDGPAPERTDMPRSVPQVMQWSVRNAARDAARAGDAGLETGLLEETLLDAKLVGWECVKATLKPAKAKKTQVVAALKGRASSRTPEARLDWLLSKAHLVRLDDFGSLDEVAFVLDPLAEYMAAYHWVDLCEAQPLALPPDVERLLALDPADSGLRAALDDCFLDEFGKDFAAVIAERTRPGRNGSAARRPRARSA